MTPRLRALQLTVCRAGELLISAWAEVAEGGRGAWQVRQLIGVRAAFMLHAGPCRECHGAVMAWGTWHEAEDELNPTRPTEPFHHFPPTADPEE